MTVDRPAKISKICLCLLKTALLVWSSLQLLFVICYLLCVTCSLFFVICYLLCYVLLVLCCLLFVVVVVVVVVVVEIDWDVL